MVKIALTEEMRKKEVVTHPFSIFGKDVAVPIPVAQFKGLPAFHVEVKTLTVTGVKLMPHKSRFSLESFRFDYNLEIGDNHYHQYKELGINAQPFLFSFWDNDKEIASLAPMCEVGLHAKQLYVISFVDEEKKLLSLAEKNKLVVKIAALSLSV